MRIDMTLRGKARTNPVELLRAYSVMLEMREVGRDGQPGATRLVDMVSFCSLDALAEPTEQEIVQRAVGLLQRQWDASENGPFAQYRLTKVKIANVCEEWVVSSPPADENLYYVEGESSYRHSPPTFSRN